MYRKIYGGFLLRVFIRKKSEQEIPFWKLVGMSCGKKCVYERKSKRKNTCRVFIGRKVGRKIQTGSFLLNSRGKAGCGRKKVSEKSIAWTRKEKNKQEKIDVKFKN